MGQTSDRCVRGITASLKPIVKWAGGKSRLLPTLLPMMPADVTDYVEPFAGGLSVLFGLTPLVAHVNDANHELINLYEVVRDDVDGLLVALSEHAAANSEEHYYAVRALDRDVAAFAALSRVERAARFLYLNKTAYNGLWRVNSRGQMNAPYGRYANPSLADESVMRAVSSFFRSHDITFTSGDFVDTLQFVQAGTFVYLDPPYAQSSKAASYTGYVAGGFGIDDQTRLAEWFRAADDRGAFVMLSNSDTKLVRELYDGYFVTEVTAPRAISCKGDGRQPVTELVVMNYDIPDVTSGHITRDMGVSLESGGDFD